MRLPQIRCSWRRPIRTITGARIFIRPGVSTCQAQRIRVPFGTGSNVSVPEVSIAGPRPSRITDRDVKPSSLGRSNCVNSTVISTVRRIIRSSAWNRDPLPIGSGVSSSCGRHLPVEAWLVALVGDEVEHLLNRAGNHDLTFDLRHLPTFFSLSISPHRELVRK